jgi:hypothetical protein
LIKQERITKEMCFILNQDLSLLILTVHLELLNAQNSKRVEVMKSTEVIFGENKLQLSFASKYFGNDERMVRTTRDFFIR